MVFNKLFRVALLSVLLSSARPLHAQTGTLRGGITPYALQCGGPTNPCLPGIGATLTGLPTTSLSPETGPFLYTLTIQNTGVVAGTFWFTCTASSSQLPCTVPSQAEFDLDVSQSTQFTISYSTLGIGTFTQAFTIHAAPQGTETNTKTATYTTSGIRVAGIPLLLHQQPGDGGTYVLNDTMKVISTSASAMTTSSYKAVINGVDVSAYITNRTIAGFTLANPPLTQGPVTWKSYGCNGTGRCDTTTTLFTYTGPPTVWALDDSLPSDQFTVDAMTPMLGPLPLPPVGLRGCPVGSDDPEIWVGTPMTRLPQPAIDTNPGGLIFLASPNGGSYVHVAYETLDHTPSQGFTCASTTYLDAIQYNFAYWQATDPHDPLWSGYPYGDRVADAPRPGFEVHYGSVGSRSAGGASEVRGLRWQLERLIASFRPSQAPAGMHSMLPFPGAINRNSFNLTINGVPFVTNSTPVRSGVFLSDALWQGGGGFMIPASDTIIAKYKSGAPPGSQPNGWNELIASIADSTGHRTYTRSRWVQMSAGVIDSVHPLVVRDYRHLDQGQCAAYGPLQCGSVVLARAIPGFVTRDRDRSLHLVYRSASQRSARDIPITISVKRTQMPPDSFLVVTTEGGAAVGDTLRYVGAKGAVSGTGSRNLQEGTNELRVLAADYRPSTTSSGLHTLSANITSLYPGVQSRTEGITIEYPEVILSDTGMTRFGDGWQLAELSRIVITTGTISSAILIRGDGSYTLWKKPSGLWVAPPGVNARLIELGSPLEGATYVLYTADGVSQGFRAGDGWQVWTKDLLGNPVRFQYDATGKRLTAITDTTGYRYEFLYNAAGAIGRVGEIDVVKDTLRSKMVTLVYTNGRLTQYKVWRSATAGDSTLYGYDAAISDAAILTTATDTRPAVGGSRVTTFVYDQSTRQPGSIIRPDGKSWLFRDAWRRASPRTGYGRPGLPLERLIFPSQMRGIAVLPGQQPGEYLVDPFGAPTWVRQVPPDAVGQSGFNFSYLEDIRDIVRDTTTGRVLRIVGQRDMPSLTDSVAYTYDALGRVLTMVRPTAAYPVAATSLDTVRFEYDSVTLATNGAWCSRLLRTIDQMGDTTAITYEAAGAGRCLPKTTTTIAKEVTTLTYGSLAAGSPAAARPISVLSPEGISQSVSYSPSSWNTQRVLRSDGAADSTEYEPTLGRPVTSFDAIGTRSQVCYDLSGRVTRQRSGFGATSPASATTYDGADLVTKTEVFLPPSGSLCTVAVPSSAQSTRTFRDRMDQVDSIIGPGTRNSSTREARNQSWRVRDGAGRPLWEFPGNGSFITRLYDWAGRLAQTGQSAVDPYASADGEPFADAATKTEYTNSTTFLLHPGTNFSAGQNYTFSYDSRGQLTSEVGRETYLNNDSTYARHMGYSRRGALTYETLNFTDGIKIQRFYQYNRRGQRALAADSVRLASNALIGTEATSATRYYYGTHTARLDSLVSTIDSAATVARVAKVQFTYDRAGRDSVRQVWNGSAVSPVVTTTTYDAGGRLGGLTTARSGTTWYQFGSPLYDLDGSLRSWSGSVGGLALSGGDSLEAETRRLLSATSTRGAINRTNSYLYDVFGNRLTQNYASNDGSGCNAWSTSTMYNSAGDNRIISQSTPSTRDCASAIRYLTDQTGDRIGEVNNDGYAIPDYRLQKMTYTAARQLYFSLTSNSVPGRYDVNWNWYDASGRRMMAATAVSNSWNVSFTPPVGSRGYYMYDGGDVAMVIDRFSGMWRVRQRLVSIGVDRPVAGRFYNSTTGTYNSIALVGDFQGTTQVALKPDGTLETTANYCVRDAFGATGYGGCGTSLNTETGYTGASTPNAAGGFTYLRNRWYDPQSGRFLTQDPIGLAGGVNLYAYAGNNPAMFSDPWGLDSVRIHDPKLQAEYDAGKQALADCANGGCSDGQMALNAAIGLSMIQSAEAAPEIIDVYGGSVQGGPVANNPNGTGRSVTIDASNSVWSSAATLSSGVVHEVLESSMAIGAGNPNFSNASLWRPFHNATVPLADDPILSVGGWATRSARSPNGNLGARPGQLYMVPR